MPPPTVRITEHPNTKHRFRYWSEHRLSGSITGVNSTPARKTYPTIRIDNFIGQVTIFVSCVTVDWPFKPHPHSLVGQEECSNGVCYVRTWITETNKEYQFKHLGIQSVKYKEDNIQVALAMRASLCIDPFNTGFQHSFNWRSIDHKAVRLAFQVFLHDTNGGPEPLQLMPAVSDIIYDKKTGSDLQIIGLSHSSGSIAGGTKIILLCKKVNPNDLAVVFYQEDGSGRVVWEACANTMLVHKQVAIVFETPPYNPPYYEPNTHRGQIIVHIRLKMISNNNIRGNSLPFEYFQSKYQERPGTYHSKKSKTIMPCLLADEAERVRLEPTPRPRHNETMGQEANPVARSLRNIFEEVASQRAGLGVHSEFSTQFIQQGSGSGSSNPNLCPFHECSRQGAGSEGGWCAAGSPLMHADLYSPFGPSTSRGPTGHT